MSPPERILVIDDSEVVLSRIKIALISAGYEVITTTQTVGVARYLRGCSLAIIDYHMPGFNGGAVMSLFRSALEGSQHRPLFYLYTTDPEAAGNAAELGFDGYFSRKGDLSALAPQVKAALRLSKLARLTSNKPVPR
jgi:DNA-binding NarL/FixJ family response regulator